LQDKKEKKKGEEEEEEEEEKEKEKGGRDGRFSRKCLQCAYSRILQHLVLE